MKLYNRWRIVLPDEEYEFAPDDMTMSECLGVERELAGTEWTTFDEWLTVGINEAHPVACQVLIWYLRMKAGQPCERRDVDFPLRRLKLIAVPDDPKDESTETSDEPGSDRSPVSE